MPEQDQPAQPAAPNEITCPFCRRTFDGANVCAFCLTILPPPEVNGQPVKMPYPWMWQAVYDDGSVLPEVDEDGHDHGFKEIDLSRVARMDLLPTLPGWQEVSVAIDAPSGQRPIFFRRVQFDVVATVSGEVVEEKPRRIITILGWQRTVRG